MSYQNSVSDSSQQAALQDGSAINKPYVIIVSLLTFVLPAAFMEIETFTNHTTISIELFGKWFVFFAVGLRLFVAGLKQVFNPAFTARQIFNIDTPKVFPVLRELGFANLCFGLTGIISLFIPHWREVSVFASGLYYGLAALQHILNRNPGFNEKFAMLTDVFIFVFLIFYFLRII